MRKNSLPGNTALALIGLACLVTTPAGAGGSAGIIETNRGAAEQRKGDTLDQLKLLHDAEDALQEGVEALKAGDYELAEQMFDVVLSYDQDNAMVHYFMALAMAGQGEMTAAMGHLKTTVRYDPSHVDARETLALIAIEMGDTAEAQEQLEALVEMRDRCSARGCQDLDALDYAVTRVQSAVQSA